MQKKGGLNNVSVFKAQVKFNSFQTKSFLIAIYEFSYSFFNKNRLEVDWTIGRDLTPDDMNYITDTLSSW